MNAIDFIRKVIPFGVVSSCFVTTSFFTLMLTSTSAQAVILPGPAPSFGLDDNPSAPIGPTTGGIPGPIPGFGAEDPFGLGGGSLAPSPTLSAISADDSSVLSPSGAFPAFIQVPSGAMGGFSYIDSFSSNHSSIGNIQLVFGVDRLSPGGVGTAVATQFGLRQQPGDMFETTSTFIDPTILGTAGDGPGGIIGFFPGAPLGMGAGTSSNTLFIDEGVGDGSVPGFGLLTAAGVVDQFTAAGPITGPSGPLITGSHDNVDSYDHTVFDTTGDGLIDKNIYFTVYPDEAVGAALTPTTILFNSTTGGTGIFATPMMMGLDGVCDINTGAECDSIDALVLYDLGILAEFDPNIPVPMAEPGVDIALFSLSPGSTSLATHGRNDADIFYTTFEGEFALYADAVELGLLPALEPGAIRPFAYWDNVDSLEVNPKTVVAPNPTTSLMWALLGLLLVAPLGRKITVAKWS